jgi:hypothetical protein
MSSWLTPTRLQGAHCSLEPLATEHLDGLADAAREGDLWKIWYTTVAAPESGTPGKAGGLILLAPQRGKKLESPEGDITRRV